MLSCKITSIKKIIVCFIIHSLKKKKTRYKIMYWKKKQYVFVSSLKFSFELNNLIILYKLINIHYVM